jgi:PAS domain-containing protein
VVVPISWATVGLIFASGPSPRFLVRFNRRAAELWGREPKIGDPEERFCGAYRLHAWTAFRYRTTTVPWGMSCALGGPVRNQEVVIERPDGSRIIVLVNIEAIKDSVGTIVGAINCFQDTTDRNRASALGRFCCKTR